MARATKSTLLVFLFCVLNVFNNLKDETENGAVSLSSHCSSIEISPESSNGGSRSYPIVLQAEDATPNLLHKVHAENNTVTPTSLKYVSLRKLIPGEKSMMKTRPIPPEMEDENSKINCCCYCCCCCRFDLYGNFFEDDWQAHQDNLQSATALFEQTICAERENVIFPGADGFETAILPPT